MPLVTLACKITLARIGIIPFFVWTAIEHGRSVASGAPVEAWRWASIAIFALAAGSDWLDGYLARNFGQSSHLGALLDPLADKLLMISALLTMTLSGWRHQLPVWFIILVISRDAVSVGVALLIEKLYGHCEVKPHPSGKVTTVMVAATLLWQMLEWRGLEWLVYLTTTLSLFSGAIHLRSGLAQINRHTQ